jgi:subfamily B ATP-binding cassette protein MsbA
MLSPIVAVTVSLCTAFVLYRGSSLILAGAMTAGGLTVFLSYLSKFFKPVQDLATMTNTIAQAAVGVDRIRAILDADTVIPQRPGARDPQALKGEIEFQNVAFSYNDEAKVLTDVSFSIKAGQMVGVVGPTGCGKSTIVSLIPRFYDPTGGSVKIDGVDLRDYKFLPLRDQIGYVLQETILFAGSVRDNIAYGHQDVTEAQIVEAAKLANADEFIQRMPHGYDTMVGERGDTLSGGQRQRIGIARALALRPKFIVADEPVSALDVSVGAQIVNLLAQLQRDFGLTYLFISHSMPVVRYLSTRIAVMYRGKIVEIGDSEQITERPAHPYTRSLLDATPEIAV